jgi:hypothetical protein
MSRSVKDTLFYLEKDTYPATFKVIIHNMITSADDNTEITLKPTEIKELLEYIDDCNSEIQDLYADLNEKDY